MEKTIVAERIKTLRESIHLSQAKLAAQFNGVDQPAVFRYENGLTFPPYNVLIQYADFFDVSMDYIFGRTENPQGKLYEYTPKIVEDKKELKEFIDMCFDENSPVNAKLKQAMFKLLEEQKK